jgi:Spy/CpxP family protein refolding chaperone
MRSILTTIFAAMLIVAAAPAFAQQGPGPQGGFVDDEPGLGTPPGGGGPLSAQSEKKREEVRKKVEAVRMWRLTEDLKLDEKSSAKLASFLSVIEEQRRGLVRERLEAMHGIRVLLKSGSPEEGKLKTNLVKLEKVQRGMMELQDKEMNGLKSILSVEQQARYVMFQQDFRREMRGMISGARGGNQGMHGPGPGRTGGPSRSGPEQPSE